MNKKTGFIPKVIVEIGMTNLFILFLITIITFYPLLNTGFTTADDVKTATNDIGWQNALMYAKEQGRFQLLWGYYELELPYFKDNRLWYLSAKLGSFFLLFAGLSYALYQLFKSSWLILATLIVYLSFIQNDWDHNALNSYPFSVNFSISLFLFSLGIFSKAIDQKNIRLALFSAVLYFFTLGDEFMVLYFPYYIVIILFKDSHDNSVLKRLLICKNYLLSVGIALAVYLFTYIVWRGIYPSVYNGNSSFSFNLIPAIKVVLTYSLSAFPIKPIGSYFGYLKMQNLQDITDLQKNLVQVQLSVLLKTLLVGFLYVRLMNTPVLKIPKASKSSLLVLLVFVGIFIPNLLLGLMEKYQKWVALGNLSYLYTYYSFIVATIFCALLIGVVNALSQVWFSIVRNGFIIVSAILLMAVTYVVEENNQLVAFDQKLSHRKFQLMDEVIKSATFEAIPEGATIVAPTLMAHQRGIVNVTGSQWSKYIKHKTGKNITLDNSKCLYITVCYKLVFHQELSDSQFVLLGKVNSSSSLGSSELTIFSMPVHTGAVILGTINPSAILPKIEIDGNPVTNIAHQLFSANLPSVSGNAGFQVAKLTSTVAINPEGLTISNFTIKPNIKAFFTQLAEGINFNEPGYPVFVQGVKGMSGYEPTMRWSDTKESRGVIEFSFFEVLPKKFILEIKGRAFSLNAKQPIRVKVGKVEKSFMMKDTNDTYTLMFETDGHDNAIEIKPPSPMSPHDLDPKSPDERKLGIGFVALKIKEEKD